MQHLAIIPDGNRRWAKRNKLKSLMGHQRGLDTFKTAVRVCLKNGIKYLSIYSFSLENFNRPEAEKEYLFNLLVKQSNDISEFIENGVRIRFIGDKSYFPEKVQPAIKKMEKQTEQLDKLNLNFLFCYGAQTELAHAAKSLARNVKAGVLAVEDINEKMIKDHLWTAGMPDPDLIIRTSKRCRLSNFLLYQAAYSEFMFLDCFWPEITDTHLQSCLDDFKQVERNFGK